MTLVGIPEEEQDAVFQVVASVLHLGNIRFREGADGESSDLADVKAQNHLIAAAKLLGCDAEGLYHALTTRTRHTHDGACNIGLTSDV
jgi:myosin V